MRSAAVPDYSLSKARLSTKLLTTLGLLGLLFGLAASTALHTHRTGLAPAAVRAYYLGEETSADTANAGAELDLMLAPGTTRSFEELAETTHIHITGGSLLLFLLCHLLTVCRIPDGLRSGIYCSAFTGFLGSFGLPWLIVYVDPAFAYLFAPAVLLFAVSLTLLCLLPLYEMWLRPRAARASALLHRPSIEASGSLVQ